VPSSGTWVFLHGTPLNPAVWDDVRNLLPVSSVAPDLTSVPAGELQRAAAARVLDDVPGDGLTVVGHSLGGQVALEMALSAPRRIERMILLCTRDSPVPAFGEAADRLRRGVPVDVDAVVRRWFTPAEIAADGPTLNAARRSLETVAPDVYARALQAIATYDRRADVARIDIPTLLLCGGLDQGCTPEVMAALHHGLPNAELRVVDGWAHMSPFVEPRVLATQMAGGLPEG
jgi:pimeloyl-ACP methyl ester carboxylesterase